MGSHIKVRNSASGQMDTFEETATTRDLRQKWGLSSGVFFVNDQGQRIAEGQEIGRHVRDGEAVTPLAEPVFGGASTPFFVVGWDERKVRSQFNSLKTEFPNASISPDGTIIQLTNIPIDCKKFNKSHTRLLISFNRAFQWCGGWAAYVDRDIRVYGEKSSHLDEHITEREMHQAHYVKVCVYNPVRTISLVTILKNVVNYLEELED